MTLVFVVIINVKAWPARRAGATPGKGSSHMEEIATRETTENPVERFNAYATAFEKAYASDDWSVLEPFFTEDADYELAAPPPLGGRHSGRSAVLDHFRDSVNQFDRCFDSRKVEWKEGPTWRDGSVQMTWTATYSVAGAPDLTLEGDEKAVFEGDRIHLLEDRVSKEQGEKVAAYLAEYGSKLKTVKP